MATKSLTAADLAVDFLSAKLRQAGVVGEDESASQLARDLISWYNVREEDLSVEDLGRLFDLAEAGRFRGWACPTCDERVYEGRPDDWGDFQGVHQVDYVSYPGRGRKTEDQCDHCRMYMEPLPVGYDERRRSG